MEATATPRESTSDRLRRMIASDPVLAAQVRAELAAERELEGRVS